MKTMIELTLEEEKSVNGGMGPFEMVYTDMNGVQYVMGWDGLYRKIDRFGTVGSPEGDLIPPPGLP